MVFVLVLVLVWLALVAGLYVWPLVDAARRPPAAYQALGRSRAGTIFLIAFVGWLGGLYYLLRIRPDLRAAAPEPPGLPHPTSEVAQPHRTPAPASAAHQTSARPVGSASRELFVRNIPSDVQAMARIPLSSEFPPLRISRADVVDAVLALDPTADVSQPHRSYVTRPGLAVVITFPLEDPLSQVLIRVDESRSDRDVVDRFLTRLLAALDVRAFDTGAATLIFSPSVG